MFVISTLEIVHRPKQIQDQRIINHQIDVEICYLHEPTADFTSSVSAVCRFLRLLALILLESMTRNRNESFSAH